MNQARVGDITQINNLVYYDSNNEEDDGDDIFHDTIEGEISEKFDAEIEDTPVDVHGKPIDNEFRHPIDQHKGATGMMFEQDGVAYVQYYLCGELYYTPYAIYGDDPEETNEAMIRMANSIKL